MSKTEVNCVDMHFCPQNCCEHAFKDLKRLILKHFSLQISCYAIQHHPCCSWLAIAFKMSLRFPFQSSYFNFSNQAC